jgi:ADP-sugar diphosphatase
MTPSITIGNQSVPVKGCSENEFSKVAEFQPFKDWIKAFNKQQAAFHDEMDVNSIEIQSIDYFKSEKIGFVKLKSEVVFKETGKSAPGIVFMVNLTRYQDWCLKLIMRLLYIEKQRGGAVSMLLILKSPGNKDKIILTLQPRVPVPDLAFPELPAGMLDGSGNFVGTAAKEIEEETGLKIKEEELIDMTELAYGDQWRGMYPSAGGSGKDVNQADNS